MDRNEKQAELSSLVDGLAKSKIAICADYRGLTVAKVTELRRELRAAGSTAKVVRNTLARIAIRKNEEGRGGNTAELDKFLTSLDGPTLLVCCDQDPVAPTKVLAKFAKGTDKFRVKGCWLDGAYVDAAGVESLSTMPGKEETLAMLLSLISTPATQLVRVLSEPGAKVARVLEAYRAKLGGESVAA